MDACQALSKARDLRAEFDQREKPLTIVKELVGDTDPEIKAFSTKFERIKNLSEFYLSKVDQILQREECFRPHSISLSDRGFVRYLGQWTGERRHHNYREGNSGIRVKTQDDNRRSEGLRN